MTAIDSITQRTVVGMLAVSNVIMVFILGHVLRVAPSDVRNEVVQQSEAIQREAQRLAGEVQRNREELSSRLPRIEALESTIRTNMRDRIMRAEVERWVEQARDLNPSLKLPDIPKGDQ